MTAIALVSELNHYHINGLHLFRDTLYNLHAYSDKYIWLNIIDIFVYILFVNPFELAFGF